MFSHLQWEKPLCVMIYYDWEVIEVRKRRWSRGHLPPFPCITIIDKQTGISPCRGGKKEGLEGKNYKTGWHCFSLSLLTDSLMCIGDEDLSCKRINTFITIIWTQSVSYSVMMFGWKKLPQHRYRSKVTGIPIYCFCTSYLFCTFILLHILLFISLFLPIYMLLCCVTFILFLFLFFCTVHWADLIWLHFTSDYTLYNLLCDE